MARWGLLAGVVGVLLLAGCDARVVGTAQADPVALQALANAPITAAGVFGPDESTVAPCSLVDLGALPASLKASPQPSDGFDDCPLTMTQSDGTAVDVSVGPLQTRDDDPSLQLRQVATLPKGMTLSGDTTKTPAYCNEYVTFTDGVLLDVVANAVDPNSTADVCPAAEALARNAAGTIQAGSVRHVTYPVGSVGPLDPCRLVTDDTLVAAGMAGAVPTPFPQRHECVWRLPTDSGTTLRLLFDIDTPPGVTDATTDTASQIAGRNSVTTQLNTVCFIRTGLHAALGNRVEEATVSVHITNGSPVDPCIASQAVATAVWPRLPGG